MNDTPSTSPAAAKPPPGRRRTRSIGRALVAVGVVAWFAGGIYNVAPNERGVVRFGGRLVDGNVPPGMHFAWPWPLGRVDRPPATDVRRVVIGISPEDRLLIEQGDMQTIAGSPQSDVLTGDINILKATMVVQYQISDPAAYVLHTASPDEWVRRAAQAALVERLSMMPVDEALTTGKTALRDDAIRRTRELLDAYRTGITVLSATVQKIDPPSAVSAAFNDVTSAQYDMERLAQRARGAAGVTISNAKAQASKRIQEANNDAARRLAQARGEADAFTKRLAEYEKAPAITRERLWLNAMEQVLAKARKYVLDEKQGDGPIQLKLMDSDAMPPPMK